MANRDYEFIVVTQGPHIDGECVYLCGIIIDNNTGIIRDIEGIPGRKCIVWEDGCVSASFDDESSLYGIVKYSGTEEEKLFLKIKYADHT